MSSLADANTGSEAALQTFSRNAADRRNRRTLWGLLLVALLALGLALMVGRYPIAPAELIGALTSSQGGGYSADALVLFRVRLPRALTAMLIGAALSSAGAAYQGAFRNPMASPDILGASSGAAFGASLGLLMGWSVIRVQGLAFVMGLAAVALACLVGWRAGRRNDPTLSLVLAGVLTGSLFMALVSFIKCSADPYNTLPAITFWLMGSLAAVHSSDLLFVAGPMVIGFVPLLLLRWRLNVLSLGDDEARALGVNTGRLRLAMVACATLMTTSSVAVAGLVGWVGLIAPHLARAAVGPDYRFLMPASAVLGGAFLVLVDCAARNILPAEVPLGLLSSLIGLPFFLFMLNRSRRGWE